MTSSSSSTEHSVLIALRELDSLEQQRRDELAARERAELAARAAAKAEAEAHIRAEQAARARAIAEAEAEVARRAHALHLRNLEIEAEVQRERDARLLRVQAEIDGQLRSHSRRATAGQRLVGAVLLAILGLAGAIGATIVTRPQASVVEHAVAGANDLRHMAALKEYAATVAAIEQDLGRLRSDNERQEAVVEAAAALRAMLQARPEEPARPVARPVKPRPQTPPGAGKKPTSGQIKICKSDDPLAEDC
ncbi:MAG TPA: hypothetical protein VGB85_19330 [Nannocystis sp.]|jgi:hypothetical protein